MRVPMDVFRCDWCNSFDSDGEASEKAPACKGCKGLGVVFKDRPCGHMWEMMDDFTTDRCTKCGLKR